MQLFINSMINIQQEILIPDCFLNFKGKREKNTVQNETASYALGFRVESKFNEATLEIFKEFGAKLVEKSHNG